MTVCSCFDRELFQTRVVKTALKEVHEQFVQEEVTFLDDDYEDNEPKDGCKKRSRRNKLAFCFDSEEDEEHDNWLDADTEGINELAVNYAKQNEYNSFQQKYGQGSQNIMNA